MAEVRGVQVLERRDAPRASGLYRSVLLVEDEVTFRRVIARNLSGRGLLVREVGTADEAVAVSTAERPDLIAPGHQPARPHRVGRDARVTQVGDRRADHRPISRARE